MATATQKIPSGYKQTEIGVIPADWDVKKLGDLGEIKMCRRIFNHETKDVGIIPFYKIGTFGKEADAYIPQDLYDNYRHRFSFPKKGDVLISAAGTIGRTIVYDGIPAYFQDSNIVWINNNEELISNGYLYYVFQIVKYNTEGGTIQRLYNSIIKSTKFICPTKPQQTAIVSILSDTDALITKTEKLIQKKKNIKKGAMQELLTGKLRLPGFSGLWVKLPLSKMINIPVSDGPHLTPRFLRNGIPFLSVNNLVGNKIDLTDLRYISKHDHEEFSKKCKPQKGDILLGKAASVGLSAVVEFDFEFNIWSPIALIRLNSDHNSKFVSYSLQTRAVINQIKLFTNSSSQGNIGMGDIEKIEFIVPPKDEQTAVANVLSDMDTEIEKLESQLTKYQNIKQGMMQTLLTGKIRLLTK